MPNMDQIITGHNKSLESETTIMDTIKHATVEYLFHVHSKVNASHLQWSTKLQLQVKTTIKMKPMSDSHMEPSQPDITAT